MKKFSQTGDSNFAQWSKHYLRDQFDFLGHRALKRRELVHTFINENGLPQKENLPAFIFALWDLPEREYQLAALDFLEYNKKYLIPDDIEWIAQLILKKSWWDTVDVIAPRLVGYLLKDKPFKIDLYPEQWIHSENIWLKRTAIIYQLKYKEKTDAQRLFRYVNHQKESEEFFIQKAIGWALREYAKTDATLVWNFIHSTSLQPLSKREALKHFRLGLKATMD